MRLAQLEGGGSGPAFLATHPATTKRIKVCAHICSFPEIADSMAMQKLERLLPEAYATRAASPQCAGLNEATPHSGTRSRRVGGGRRPMAD